jgi:hypothetical protein
MNSIRAISVRRCEEIFSRRESAEHRLCPKGAIFYEGASIPSALIRNPELRSRHDENLLRVGIFYFAPGGIAAHINVSATRVERIKNKPRLSWHWLGHRKLSDLLRFWRRRRLGRGLVCRNSGGCPSRCLFSRGDPRRWGWRRDCHWSARISDIGCVCFRLRLTKNQSHWRGHDATNPATDQAGGN